ncbi:O-antigen ligase family protein [Vibrio ostreicida]|uniref:O-antigen ligase family protein n=1 Tax=Vibrio ostreicida TaxID=526588 RepID=UPI0009702999|nr:O-antigen ligase family protein [Vibrio ostreicida]
MKKYTSLIDLNKFLFASILLTLSLLLSTKNLSVAIAAITLIVSLFYLKSNIKSISLDKYDKLVILILSSYLISNIPLFILDGGETRYFKGASRLILCIPIYLFFKHYSPTKYIYYKALIWGTGLGSIGAFSIAFYQFFIEGRARVDGFLYSINFGYLSCLLAVLSLALLIYKYHRFLLFFSFLFSTSAMLMTLTRGAIVALPIVILLACLIDFKKIGLLKISLFFSVIAIASVVLYNNTSTIKKRVDYTIYEAEKIINGDVAQAESSGGRIMLWKAALEAFKTRPFFGLTYSERETLNHELANRDVINSWTAGVSRGHAHSQYFEQMASGGLLGLISLIFTLLIPFLYFLKHRAISRAAYVGNFFVFAFSICCLTEVPLQQNLISTFYGYMLALLFAVTQHEINQNALHGEVNDKLEIET